MGDQLGLRMDPRVDTFDTPRGAVISADGLYRYRLWRVWGNPRARVAFIGVNPSTADAQDDDHTIRKEIGFARAWGFGALDKVNLFAYRVTNVRALPAQPDPVGPDNDGHLRAALASAGRIVLAWGKHTAPVQRLVFKRLAELGRAGFSSHSGGAFDAFVRPGVERGTLGFNDDGSPRHPLTLAYTTPFLPLPWP